MKLHRNKKICVLLQSLGSMSQGSSSQDSCDSSCAPGGGGSAPGGGGGGGSALWNSWSSFDYSAGGGDYAGSSLGNTAPPYATESTMMSLSANAENSLTSNGTNMHGGGGSSMSSANSSTTSSNWGSSLGGCMNMRLRGVDP